MAVAAPASFAVQDFTLERLDRLYATREDVTWRHDVDFDPDAALRMAEFEAERRVRSTFYVMARSEFYNPFAKATRGILRRIRTLGHQIGMHVDLEQPRTAPVTTETMRVTCRWDRELFDSGGVYVSDRVSFHAPPRSIYWRDVPGFDHALAGRWRDRCLSDSRGVWREEPEAFLQRVEGPVQLNLHPEWWFWPPEVADQARAVEALKP